MGAMALVAATGMRRRWWRLAALVLLVGLVGAGVLATAAGARRSSSALERFNASSRSATVEFTTGPKPTVVQLQALRASGSVRAAALLQAFGITLVRIPQLSAVAAATDDRFGTVVDRPPCDRGSVWLAARRQTK